MCSSEEKGLAASMSLLIIKVYNCNIHGGRARHVKICLNREVTSEGESE